MGARILLAGVRQAYTRLFAVLPGDHLHFVTTFPEARAALNGDAFDLFMIGVHFDESRMFELLQYVRADRRYEGVPVVCFRGKPVADPDDKLSLEGVDEACQAMGADCFFDLLAFPDDTLGNAAVRNMIHAVIQKHRPVIGC